MLHRIFGSQQMFWRNYSVAKANFTEKGWFSKASLIAKNADHPLFRAVLTKDMYPKFPKKYNNSLY
jgi:hypothetical protein